MLSAGLQLNRTRGEDRFYYPAKARRNQYQNQQQYQKSRLARSDTAEHGDVKSNKSAAEKEEEEKKNVKQQPAWSPVVPEWEPPADPSLCNLQRFIAAITPSVNAQYLSKTTMRGLRTCEVEYQPYFVLGDLWESFKEWSAYGAGVPIVLDGRDSVVQYYVPYLSAMQIYIDVSKSSVKTRTTNEDSDGDSLSRDSSSDDVSDSERYLGLALAKGAQKHAYQTVNFWLKLERLSLEKQKKLLHGGFFNNEDEPGNSREYLLFEFLERALPHTREPLADKIAELTDCYPDLKTSRSCDVLPSSWFSVAWYPIYRIPTGPTLKDLDACFLTYHCLRTPVGGDVATAACAPVLSFPEEMDGMPRIALPVFGLACYKFRGASWLPDHGTDRELVEALKLSAKTWVDSLQVNHPDYQFFDYRT